MRSEGFPENYLGDETLKSMKKTKWYVFARLIDQMLYAGTTRTEHQSERFVTPTRVYLSDMPSGLVILGKEDHPADKNGASLDVPKALRELSHECVRMAIKEVT